MWAVGSPTPKAMAQRGTHAFGVVDDPKRVGKPIWALPVYAATSQPIWALPVNPRF